MTLRVTSLSLIDILKHYFNYSDSDFEKQGRHLYLTRCPLHNEKNGHSLALYDKTEKGIGWDWTCFGRCSTGGTAPKLLVDAGLFPSYAEAVKDLRDVYKLNPPDKVTVENFADYKGLNDEFLRSRGCRDTEKGMLIPFYSEDCEVVAEKQRLAFTGTKRFNFLSGENTIYGLDLLKSYSDDIIYVFEGETDTLTAIQSGLPAIGIPGINSWKTAWNELLDRFTTIVAVPDQDSAGQEMVKHLGNVYTNNLFVAGFPHHFNDANDFFLYGCNTQIETFYTHFTTGTPVPATPDTFISAVLADNSILSNDVAWRYIFNALNGDEVSIMLFIEKLKGIAKIPASIINKAYKPAYAKYVADNRLVSQSEERIFIRDGCYYKTVYGQSGSTDIAISNFTINLLHTIETDGDHVRVCRLSNDNGQVSRIVKFDSDTLTKVTEFMSACMAAGNYIFKGGFEDLISVNEVLLRQEENIIHSPAYIGRLDDRWLMGSYGVDSKGGQVEADEEGVVTLDDDRYMLRNLNIADADDEHFVPHKPDSMTVSDEYLRDVAYTMKSNLGGFEAWVALGFTVAGWHSDEIFAHNGDKSYPILFVSGKRNSGKTYLSRWLMSAYGFAHLEGSSFSMPSVVSMVRKLGYYSSLPVWYDDYRNNIKDIKYRNEFLLGAYNRQGADKGTRSGFGVRAERIRGLLLLSGEDTPQDNAVLSRCTVINVSAYTRDDSQLFHLLQLAEKFPEMGHNFLIDKQKHGSADILTMLDFIQQMLVEKDIDGRLAKNTAVFAAGFLSAFGHVIDENDKQAFLDWLTCDAAVTKATTNKEHVVAKFFDDCLVLMDNHHLESGQHYAIENGNCYMWYKACYDVWVREYGADIKKTVLLEYIKKEPFTVEVDRMKRLSSTSNKRCLVVDYKLIDNPDFTGYCIENDDYNSEY